MNSLILFFVFFLYSIPIFCQTVVWDESLDGDLQADGGSSATVFQEVILVDGENIIRGSVGNNIFNGLDANSDAFSFAVPPRASITALDITSLTISIANTNGTYFDAYSGNLLTLNSGMVV
jgi:hypothetical protein